MIQIHSRKGAHSGGLCWPFCSEPFPHGERLLQSWPVVSFKPHPQFVPSDVAGLERRKRPHVQPCGAPTRRTGAPAQKRPKQRFLLPWHGFRRIIGVAL